MKYTFFVMTLFFLFSCNNENDIVVTDQYVYSPKGIPTGFTIQMLRVKELNKELYPKVYEEDSIRVDLVSLSESKKPTKIFYKRKNDGYYWSYIANEKYDTMPIQFVVGKWYLLWSKDFDNAFETSSVHFFLYKDSDNKLLVYKEDVGKL